MLNNDFIFDITDVDIDICVKKVQCLLDSIKSGCYNKNIKVNDTIIFMNFLSNEKLNSKSIIKILD